MYAYLFWDKIRPKTAKILQFYVITDQNCKPVCSYLRVYVYLRAQSICWPEQFLQNVCNCMPIKRKIAIFQWIQKWFAPSWPDFYAISKLVHHISVSLKLTKLWVNLWIFIHFRPILQNGLWWPYTCSKL